jgi:catalase (peroxidase I)
LRDECWHRVDDPHTIENLLAAAQLAGQQARAPRRTTGAVEHVATHADRVFRSNSILRSYADRRDLVAD